MNAAGRGADRVARRAAAPSARRSRPRHTASAPTAPPVKRGMPSRRLDAAARHEGAKGGERIRRRRPSGSAARGRSDPRSRAVPGSGPGRRGPRAAAAARCRGTSSARAARRPRPIRGGTPASSRRRAGGTPRSGVSRSAGRVARRSSVSALPASRFAWVRLSGSVSGHVRRLRWSMNQNDLSSPGTKGRAFRGATLIRRCRTFVTDGWSPDRRSALPAIAGALRRSLLGSRVAAVAVRSGGSRVHSPPLPSRLPPAAGSLCRHSTGTRPVHSPYSRCRPGV